MELRGEVYDSFTKAKVKAFITLMRSDSTVVDTMTCWTWGTNSYYELRVPAKNEDFIIKATADGYEDTTMVYELRHISRNNFFDLPRILMKKKQNTDEDIYKEVGMDGVVITGTKVKLAYRGDTLVYNASAFNLPEGSMLDGLIRQMPGAELKDNGDIYINGKKVDYLTLNGKDFFKGQNKVMLDNLPYYTVKELKVYDKSTKQSELIGHDIEKKDYVMDVQLKRQYNRGFMGNIEAGAGTDDRYLARLFGLYYDDHSRFSIFGNTNNVNENRQPGGEGDWSPSNMPEGLHATKQTGLHLSTEDQDKNWEEELDATFNWTDADNWQRGSSERFASGGNIMSGTESWSRQKDFRISASNYFQMKKPFTLFGSLQFSYSNGDRNSSSQDSTYRNAIINQTWNSNVNHYRTLDISGSIGYHNKFDWGDILSLGFSGSYNKTKPSDAFSLTRTYYAQTDSTGLRHYYTDNQSDSYQYEADVDYTFQLLNHWFINPTASYSQDMNNGGGLYYRLDKLKEVAADKQQTEWLPSTREALLSVIDDDNTSRESSFGRTYSGKIDIHHSDDDQFFSVSLPIRRRVERLHYTDASLDTIAHRSYTDFTPSINWYRWGIKKGINQLGYSMGMSRPDLSSLIPNDDTTNPLVTQINNPDLKSTLNHNFYIGYQINNDSTRHFFNMWGTASLTQNAMGTRTIYDTTTGAYTFMQDNINGNWNGNITTNYEQPLDSAKRLTLRQNFDMNYIHSVDFPVNYVTTSDQQADFQKSTVHNWTLHEKLTLEYQRDKLTMGIRGEVNWRRSTSTREDFENISAFDFNYGGHLRYTIPWLKVYIGTDIYMYSRRGYQSEMMNTDDLVWNAELSRTLFKERVTLKLTAFDLLHQLSSTQYSVNAQGRTESWNNCIPRYVMLSLAYKFTKTPKK
ncbi:MAG: outer membrane beta-barrel protein [Prevotella sp.]|nr:outer membrane beta-barrel protein [Prevotella sp.]